MVVGRKIIAVLVGALAITATVHADMVPASVPDGDARPPAYSLSQPDTCRANLADVLGSLDLTDLIPGPVGVLPEAEAQMGQAPQAGAPAITSDGQNSLSLCLYALMGLGVLRSMSWAKRLSFTAIPDWYHDAGPYQIGHSHAISADCLCSAPIYCFIQPHSTADDSEPQYRRRVVVSLWRQSQFTPTTLAPRGPPSIS